MAHGNAVARRYAQALFEAARGAGATAQVGRDLDLAVVALWGDEKLRAFFTGDRLPAEAKKRLVVALCAGTAKGVAGEATKGAPGEATKGAPGEATKGAPGEAGGSGLHHLVRNFLLLAVDKRREAYVAEVARAYALLADRAEGLVDVEVRTAVELGEEGRGRLHETLAGKLERRVRVSFVIDPSLVGGIQVKVDDRLFDASLRRRLDRLGEHLAKARVGV